MTSQSYITSLFKILYKQHKVHHRRIGSLFLTDLALSCFITFESFMYHLLNESKKDWKGIIFHFLFLSGFFRWPSWTTGVKSSFSFNIIYKTTLFHWWLYDGFAAGESHQLLLVSLCSHCFFLFCGTAIWI